VVPVGIVSETGPRQPTAAQQPQRPPSTLGRQQPPATRCLVAVNSDATGGHTHGLHLAREQCPQRGPVSVRQGRRRLRDRASRSHRLPPRRRAWRLSSTAALTGTLITDRLDKKLRANGSSSGSNTRSTGTTATTSQATELAVALLGYSANAGCSTQWRQTTPGPALTNSFTETLDVGTTKASGTNVGLLVAVRDLSATGAIETTGTMSASVIAQAESLVATFQGHGRHKPSRSPVCGGVNQLRDREPDPGQTPVAGCRSLDQHGKPGPSQPPGPSQDRPPSTSTATAATDSRPGVCRIGGRLPARRQADLTRATPITAAAASTSTATGTLDVTGALTATGRVDQCRVWGSDPGYADHRHGDLHHHGHRAAHRNPGPGPAQRQPPPTATGAVTATGALSATAASTSTAAGAIGNLHTHRWGPPHRPPPPRRRSSVLAPLGRRSGDVRAPQPGNSPAPGALTGAAATTTTATGAITATQALAGTAASTTNRRRNRRNRLHPRRRGSLNHHRGRGPHGDAGDRRGSGPPSLQPPGP